MEQPVQLLTQENEELKNKVKELEEKLIVRYVADTIKEKNLQDGKGKFPSRNGLQTYTLLDVINEFEFDNQNLGLASTVDCN